MNVLITHPDFKDPGGVAAHYAKLKDKFQIPVQHFIIGKRAEEQDGVIPLLFRAISDYYRFVKTLRTNDHDVIHTNPSLDFKAFIRDGIFALLGKLLGKKVVVFFHGWQKPFESTLQRYGLWLFKFLYGKANVFIVLAVEFKEVLESWRVSQKIYCEGMVVDDEALRDFDINKAIANRGKSKKWRILFLARLVREKGLYETIEAFSLLQHKYPMFELIIAGDGNELNKARSFVAKHSIPNVTFTGYVVGEEKTNLFKSAHIYCFPTYYGEGLPNTICESMAFGLPVITRPVGGIADFFENGKHGFAVTSKEPKVLANLIEQIFVDKKLYKRISICNYEYALSNFLASSAALRLEKIYEAALMN